jgi:tetratricopeptide (TPR) repeat protein
MLARLIAVVVCASLWTAPQNESAVRQFTQKQFEAVAIYRHGNTSGALALLASMSIDEQRKGVEMILAQQERIAAGWPPRRDDIPWTARLLRALAALHMEAAAALQNPADLDARLRDDASEHMELGETLFAFVFLTIKEDKHSGARWRLAIGLDYLSKGALAAASSVLRPACKNDDEYAPLLVACGTLDETLSSHAGDPPVAGPDLAGLRTFDPTLSRSVRGLQDARYVRKTLLTSARKYFERAAALDAEDSEAPLRLGNVYYGLGDYDKAEQVLQSLLARAVLKDGDAHLAHLFLGRIREHQTRLEDAGGCYDRAISLAATQTALIARAQNAQQRGNAVEAAAFAERAAAPKTIADPWWTYALGQYWIKAALFRQLRTEALQ